MSRSTPGSRDLLPDVGFFCRMSASSAGCRLLPPDVSYFRRMSAASTGCQLLPPDVSYFRRMSATSAGCQLLPPDVSYFRRMSATSARQPSQNASVRRSALWLFCGLDLLLELARLCSGVIQNMRVPLDLFECGNKKLGIPYPVGFQFIFNQFQAL